MSCKKLFTSAALTGLTAITVIAALPTFQATAQPVTNDGSTQRCLPQRVLVRTDVAVIYNTGSTNAPCYRIFLSKTGKASYVVGDQQKSGEVSRGLARDFYRDIKAAEPLSELPKLACAKSVSFGSSTFVRLGGDQSPDITCAANSKGRDLFKDSQEIAHALGILSKTNINPRFQP